MIYLFIKRFIDIIVSLLLIVVSSPLIISISIIIKIKFPKDPIIYKGKRAALGNGDFTLYKFRTMIPHEEVKGKHSTALNDKRLTKIGISLRKYKLDELPQLFNVLNGSMSLVGPRPQVMYYTDKYEGDFRDILAVKPGITDLASLFFVNMDSTLGKDNVDEKYEQEIEPLKNKLRLKYVRKRSLKLDIYILMLTGFRLFGLLSDKKIKSILSRI